MRCKAEISPERIQAFHDDALTEAEAKHLESHVSTCPVCAPRLAALEAIHEQLSREGVEIKAPMGLKTRIRQALDAQAPRNLIPEWRSWLVRVWNDKLPGVVSLAAAGLALAFFWGPGLMTAEAGFNDELVSSHVRSMMENHLIDVATSDHHVVKPWLSARLDFSPPVVEGREAGCKLIGGRLDYVAHQKAAALVYLCGAHTVNIFVEPSQKGAYAPRLETIRGFSVLSWGGKQLACQAVSDANPETLKHLAKLIQAEAARL